MMSEEISKPFWSREPSTDPQRSIEDKHHEITQDFLQRTKKSLEEEILSPLEEISKIVDDPSFGGDPQMVSRVVEMIEEFNQTFNSREEGKVPYIDSFKSFLAREIEQNFMVDDEMTAWMNDLHKQVNNIGTAIGYFRDFSDNPKDIKRYVKTISNLYDALVGDVDSKIEA